MFFWGIKQLLLRIVHASDLIKMQTTDEYFIRISSMLKHK